MDRWLFAITVVGSITYTVTHIVRALARHRPNPASLTRSSRLPHARPLTPREMHERGW